MRLFEEERMSRHTEKGTIFLTDESKYDYVMDCSFCGADGDGACGIDVW